MTTLVNLEYYMVQAMKENLFWSVTTGKKTYVPVIRHMVKGLIRWESIVDLKSMLLLLQ